MRILMHCGGMPFNGDTIKTESLGGSETAAYYVARELVKRGHRVTLFTNKQDMVPGPNGRFAMEGVFEGVKYIWAGPQSNECPLGHHFHYYAMNTPTDVCIIQRAPGAFAYKWASKLNIAWVHDLAMHRNKPSVMPALWNIDAICPVSEWHKKQLLDVYGIDASMIMPVTNGVDLKLFEGKIKNHLQSIHPESVGKVKLLYSSRPERGLEHLVRKDGIMERLADLDPKFHLYVCSYDNRVPQMSEYYEQLYARIEELPNCTNLGSLTKQQLADVMRQCDAQVYPTEFEEVSCITAMETMAAGLPFISSECAALPETCGTDPGCILIPLKDGKADEDLFVDFITKDLMVESISKAFKEFQLEKAKQYTWARTAEQFEKHIEKLFADRQKNPETVLQHLLRNSDYYAALHYPPDGIDYSGTDCARAELTTCYGFAREGTWKEHYEAYYEYEKNRGVNYGPESLDGNTRFEEVNRVIASLPKGSTVLDYGCAHGHYTVNLAKRNPDKKFVGVDIAASNVEKARKWAADDGVTNVEFHCGEARFDRPDGLSDICTVDIEGPVSWVPGEPRFDAIIAAEVLEHVARPWDLADCLAGYLRPRGKMVITTPFGPWEAIGYREHWPWRAHVHHLENEDLRELFGHHPGFIINSIPSGGDQFNEMLGSYLTIYQKPTKPSGRINYDRKLSQINPGQTLAVCLIVKDSEHTLGKCLESIKDIAHEIIIGIDEKSKDGSRAIAEKYARGFSPKGELVFTIPSPLDTGFDEARNTVIAKAKADWIMWIDSDEVLFHPERVVKYLRQNQFNAYALRQIHYSVDPAGIMRVDLPARLFRNKLGIKFFGHVHEHPELGLNKGIGYAMVLPDVTLSHYGYSTEEVRRGRFQRNIGLLKKDREKYPARHLGKFLWVRDLAQMCRWEGERNGGNITPVMRARAREGIKLWEELLADRQVKMLTDAENLSFYSTLVEILGGGFDFGFKIDASKLNGGAHVERQPTFSGRFLNKDHAEKLFKILLDEKTAGYESKYF